MRGETNLWASTEPSAKLNLAPAMSNSRTNALILSVPLMTSAIYNRE